MGVVIEAGNDRRASDGLKLQCIAIDTFSSYYYYCIIIIVIKVLRLQVVNFCEGLVCMVLV